MSLLHRDFFELKCYTRQDLNYDFGRYLDDRKWSQGISNDLAQRIWKLLKILKNCPEFPADALSHMALLPLPGGVDMQVMRRRFSGIFSGTGNMLAQQAGISSASKEKTEDGYLLVFCSLEERNRTWERARTTLKRIRGPIPQDLAQVRFIRAQEFIWAYTALSALLPQWMVCMLGDGMVRTKFSLPTPAGKTTPGEERLGFGYPSPLNLKGLHWVAVPDASAQPKLGVVYAAFFPI